ncbi:MAG: hypothetical protein Q3985_04990 [Eubacteriales bacterium]|nr:hypothetical protein [Eubacteriales bacterium]
MKVAGPNKWADWSFTKTLTLYPKWIRNAASTETGDAGIALYGVLSIISLVGWVGKKKSRSK